MTEIVIVAAKRTATGAFLGGLSEHTAVARTRPGKQH